MQTFFKRALNFLRPKPRYIALPVEDILARSAARDVVERFNDFYYTSGNAGTLDWRGVEMIKNPCDIWTSLELLQALRPCAIIETGTHHGASAMFYADMCRVLGIACRVITVDLNPKWHVDPDAFGITSVRGISTDPGVVAQVRQALDAARGDGTGAVLVFLDSDHSRENVLRELQIYGAFVTPGSYVVVEDTNVNGHPSFPDHGPGPWEAVDDFLAMPEGAPFEIDRNRERFLLTFNPRGYLRRVR